MFSSAASFASPLIDVLTLKWFVAGFPHNLPARATLIEKHEKNRD
jgi:hypothetical protein